MLYRIALFLLLLAFFMPTLAQKLPTIEEKVAGWTKMPGFMDLYWDGDNGKVYMEISRWDTEILYATSLPSGLGSNDIGLDRGLGGGSSVVRFSKVGRKAMMVQPNYKYRAVTGDAFEKRAVEQSFARSTLWGFPIIAETGARSLVDVTPFLLRDAMQVSNRLRRMQQGNYTLDESRSAIHLASTRNFPQNTEIGTTISFTNADGTVGGLVQSVVPSPQAITVGMHHSFVQLPDSNYTPRIFDPRSSFIPMSYFDYSTPISEPIEKYLVNRHRLQKKDPGAARSEAVKPIVYYLDNGTPEPIRSALLEGASWWNQAFEAAGYINAFQVRVLPDTADPMDIRYNMINWVHRSTRGWSYGASVTDPRTGEIIKGQVTLGSLRVRQDYLIAQGLLAPFENGIPADDKMLKMALARLRQLSAHEVGHTLGLMHNYASSVSNRASVMDYPHPLIRVDASGAIDMSQAYDARIGEWDKVSINWGYREFAPGPRESNELDRILDQASGRGLQFIADQDARAPGGLHPSAHLWDNGKDAVTELQEVMRVRETALRNFGKNNLRAGFPMAWLEDVLVPVYYYHRYQVEAVCKLVGGMDYAYSLNGKVNKKLEPLPRDVQLRALDAALRTIDPAFLETPQHIVDLIPPRPDAYGNERELFAKRTGLAFDPLSPAEAGADLPLSFLFHPERISRLALNQKQGLSLEDMLSRTLAATWKAPRRTGMQALVQQQTEQVLLTYLLANSVDEKISFAGRSAVRKALDDLKAYIETQKKTAAGPQYAGHLALALERMKAPEKARPTIHAPIPPGAPIGCGE
jgi:hypothetical protein